MADHPITIDMLEEGHSLLLGQTRSGKTYQLRAFLERLRRADRRVGAIDKLGNHWGLTLSADGKRPGLDFVIFGGKRAHVPMGPGDGGKLGRLFVERNVPAIFDVSQWHHDEQQEWVADFADAVFLYNEGALHLSLDEVQSWIPQGGGGDAFRSVLRLAEQGLGNGIHLIMAAQRWSRIDKSAAGMASLVVTMRQFGTADRKAMRDLLAVSAEDMARIEKEIVTLPAGTGFVWDPGPATLARYDFPPNSTFDSSRTPKHGDTPPPAIAVSSELVEELRQALAPPPPKPDFPDDSIPADPIGAYEKGSVVGTMLVERDREIARLQTRIIDVANVALEISTAVQGVLIATNRALAETANAFEAYFPDVCLPPELLRAQAQYRSPVDLARRVDDLGSVQDARKMSMDGPQRAGVTGAERTPADQRVTAGETAQPRDRDYRSLAVLAAIYPAGLTEAAWAGRAGRARKGGAWQEQRRRYAGAGLIERRGYQWHATPAGFEAAGGQIPDMPSPGPDLVEWWAGRVGAAGKLLRLVHGCPGVTRQELAELANMTATGGSFGAYVQELRRNELIEQRSKHLFAHPNLTGEDRQ